MKTSDKGVQFICSFEGYGKELPDGSCTAYQERINGKLDIPTIGFGCTKGVKMGMVWTRQEAEYALRAELEGHEKRVERLTTVELNQNQFDALVSFDFNTGGLTVAGGQPSGVLKAVNARDWTKVCDELKRWNKFGGREARGLTSRRAAEVALFMQPVDEVATDYMPQQPEQAKAPMGKGTIATIWATIGTTVTTIATNGIPAPPDKLTNSAANIGAWKGLVGQITDPIVLVTGACLALIWGVTYLRRPS